jgi:hypothetical protein
VSNRIVLAALLFTGTLTAADPPKDEKKVPPLADLIKVLKDGTRDEQVEAAEAIRDHYDGKCLDAVPQLVASMGRELNIPRDSPSVGDLVHRLGQASHKAGPKRFKILFEMTTDKDPLIRAGAFQMLFAGTEHYLRKVSEWADAKSELDMGEFLKACERGAKDEDALVRGRVMNALTAFWNQDEKLSKPAVELLAKGLEDRELRETRINHSAAYHAAGALMGGKVDGKLVGFGANGKVAFDALLKSAESDDRLLAWASAMALGRMACSDEKLAVAALKLFRRQLTDPKQTDAIRKAAAAGVSQMSKYAEPAVADLAALLNLPKCSPQLRRTVYTTLNELGPHAAPALPALLARLEATTDPDEQQSIFYTIAAIGPAARDAVKVIQKWADKNPNMDGSVRTRMNEALEKMK